MAISIVQSGGESDDNATLSSRAITGLVSGNRLVIAAYKGGIPGTHATFAAGDCTKTAGTATIGAITLDKGASFNNSGEWEDVGIWSCSITGSGTATMQVSDGESMYWGIALIEISGSGGTNIGATNSGSGATGAPDTGSVTPAAYQAALIAVATSNQGTNNAYGLDAAFTSIFTQPDGTLHQTGQVGYRILSSGSDGCLWTAPTASPWAAAIVAYTEVSGGGGGPTPVTKLNIGRLRPNAFAPGNRR